MTDLKSNRRFFIKATGGVAIGTGVAGCSDTADDTQSSEVDQSANESDSTASGPEDDPEDDSEDTDSVEDVEPEPEKPQLDHLHGIRGQTYPSESSTTLARRYEWNALGGEWWLELNISSAIADYYENRYGRNPNFDAYVSDPFGDQYITEVVRVLGDLEERQDLSKPEVVNLAVAFVQSMNYTKDSVSSPFDQYTYYPVETLVQRGGDCEDSAILLAAILRELGYGCVLLGLYDAEPAHMALGVKGEPSIPGTYYTYNDDRYYFVETTGEGWQIGEMPELEGSTSAEIINIAPSSTLVYEFATAVTDQGSIELETTVWNYGPASPLDTTFNAVFEDRSDQYYSETEVRLGRIQNEQGVTKRIELTPPEDRELRLNTAILTNGEIHDLHRSTWQSSPNN